MTSGTFKSVPIETIWVNRELRQRRDLADIPSLAESIDRIGLIHPPVIRRNGELIAGERRWNACRRLGWTAIPIQYVDELPEEELHVIELEENIRRVDISWQDQCRAVDRYHELRTKTDSDWSQTKTAEALGLTKGEVTSKRQVAKELESGNARVLAAPKYSTARNIIGRTQERKRDSVLKDLEEDEEGEEEEVPLICDDFHEWARAYDGDPFNFIHCDFPYGVNADKHAQGAGKDFGGYVDTKDTYVQLLTTLAEGMKNVVSPSAHLIFWFSMDYYQMTAERLQDMGWSVNPFPLVWHKSDNTGILPDPQRGPRRIYETAFLASRGDRKVVQAVSNCFAAPVTKTVHMSEKSLPMLKHFMRMTVDEYSRVLDPTAGSGNAVKAALALGATKALGIERDEEFYNLAKENWDGEQLL